MRFKVSPKTPSSYLCQESLDWIRAYTLEYFDQHNIKSQGLWLVDDNKEIFSQNIPSEGVIDIILTGSFFLRLLELIHWPVQEMRLWTFSSDLRETISHLLKIDKNIIGLIPHPHTDPLKDPQDHTHWVYAGRLNWGKNIEALLALTSYLQQSTHPHLQLTLYGENDPNREESFGRTSGEDFNIESLVHNFKWITPPQIMGHQKTWNSDLSRFSHYLSLSTSMYEDFAVSVSQAMNHLPALLSDWGGHKHKAGAHLLPSHLIFSSHEAQWIKQKKTELLASSLQNKALLCSQNVLFHPAQVANKDTLAQATQSFILKQSPQILLCLRDCLDDYADTAKGRDVFFYYRQQFGSLRQISKVLIYTDYSLHLDFDNETFLIHEMDLFINSVQRILMGVKEIRISSRAGGAVRHLKENLGLGDILTIVD